MTHNVGSTEFHASRDSRYASRSSHTHLTTLTIRGHRLSTVASIHPRDFHNHKPSQTLHDWINLADVTAWVQSQIQLPLHENYPESSLTIQSRILRTLLAEGAGPTTSQAI